MRQSSIIDIISPIMVGPSSYHTAGAVRLGLLARHVFNSHIRKIKFRLYNSYATTGKGHGTDKGLLHGSPEMGWNLMTTANGLLSNYISALLVDQYGAVWVGAGGSNLDGGGLLQIVR